MLSGTQNNKLYPQPIFRHFLHWLVFKDSLKADPFLMTSKMTTVHKKLFSSVFSFFTSLPLSVILSFHVSSFVKCLFRFSAYFSIGLSFSYWFLKHSFYIFWILILDQLCVTVIPQFSACLFTTVTVT